jgi:Resolvase, N terminal domain
MRRIGIYLRVSTGGQTTENQRRELEVVAKRSGWQVVQVYEDAETMHRTALACAFAGALMACNVVSLHAAPLPTNVAAMKSMVADSSIQVRWHYWHHRG